MSDALDTTSPYDVLARKRTRGGVRKQLTPEEALQKQLDATYDTASFLPITGEIIAAKGS